MATEKNKEEVKVVDLRERTTVYSTDLDKYHETGSAMHVATAVAENLVKKGLATTEAPKAKSK
jgi:hypothetical protein